MDETIRTKPLHDSDYIEPTETPVLPLRNTVLFPEQIVPLFIGREHSLSLVNHILEENTYFVAVAQKEMTVENPDEKDLYHYGTLARVVRVFQMPNDSRSIVVKGVCRVKIHKITSTIPFYKGIVNRVQDKYEPNAELETVSLSIRESFKELSQHVDYVTKDSITLMMNSLDEGNLADIVTSTLGVGVPDKQKILESLMVSERLNLTLQLLYQEIERAKLDEQIQEEVKSSINQNQREYFLREQMKAIKKELGDEEDSRIAEIEEKIREAELPEEALSVAEREIDRLKRISKQSPEYNVSLSYLELMCELPWSISTEDDIDITRSKEVLEEDHYGLEKVKTRILEYLAVRKLREEEDENASIKGPILCFVGPPGTGKTSVAKSIARAIGRNVYRMSLGGVRDEAEIRGHRRTYIGALPGRIIQGLKRAGSNNPVFILDEIDKLGADYKGDPSSALLEVLDPEQNFAFSDHYLETSFDLSKVMFIATANWGDTIPGPLRDRMELIEFSGYTLPEKCHIAEKYLIPKQVRENGLNDKSISFTREGIESVIQNYTREAGVRNLEREIANICRKVAKLKVESPRSRKKQITPKTAAELLGKPRFYSDMAERMKRPGIAIGLAWTQVGGDILFIEASKMPGDGKLQLTGKLGDVMKESAQAAITFVRANAAELGVEDTFNKTADLHIHVPAGAVPKDGPSAGVTLLSAIVSVLTDRKVKNNLAMTGEITLRGSVLPVGGIKEKVIAAHRANLKTIILPEKNSKDLDDIPDDIRNEIEFHFVSDMMDVIKLALDD